MFSIANPNIPKRYFPTKTALTEIYDPAPSCWKDHSWLLNMVLVRGFSTLSKMVSLYTCSDVFEFDTLFKEVREPGDT